MYNENKTYKLTYYFFISVPKVQSTVNNNKRKSTNNIQYLVKKSEMVQVKYNVKNSYQKRNLRIADKIETGLQSY